MNAAAKSEGPLVRPLKARLCSGAKRSACIAVIALVAAIVQGCATHGVTMIAPGQSEKVMLDAGSDKLPKGDPEFVLSPMDALQVEVYPKQLADAAQKIDYGSVIRVEVAFDSKSYSIMPGDTLRIAMDSEPDKAMEVVVRPDGDITLLPLFKEVKAAGSTPTSLAVKIAKLSVPIMIAPRVTVSVLKSTVGELERLNGNYQVDREGFIVLPALGRIRALEETSDTLASMIEASAHAYFNNSIKVATSVAQLTGREADPRLDPDGRQYFRGTVRVSPEGTVFIPQAGAVTAAGRSVAELRGDITTALQSAYKNPISVNVTLLESGNMSVFVGGEVKTPGHYPYSGSTTLLQALASAGWINEWADMGKIVLLHPSAAAQGQYVVYETNLNDVIEGKGSPQDLKLAPRDIIIVPRSGIAKVDLWIDQYIRKFLPLNLGAGYSYGQGDFSSRVSQ